ncbi:MAG TPA: hypothetical protein VHJ20_14775 [Polyangia bacterium]|nr:hypothetical protein [Polyangia bacterium]
MLGPQVLALVFLLVGGEASADAAATTDDAAPTESSAEGFLATYFPAPVDGPALRLPFSPNRLYVDLGYASTSDLSSLPYITGKARNLRLAAGGTWRWRRLAFSGELPMLQATTIDVATVMNQPPVPADAHQTAYSLGDLRLGADWTVPLGDSVGDSFVGGFGFRVRLPTHTTRFDFHLIDGSTAAYAFPYYFHLEPTAILGGVLGRFLFVVNQGAVVLMGPDATFSGIPIHVPTIAYWDAAYAVTWAPLDELAASVELSTDVQLNHVDGLDFQKFNDVRSVWLAPALQLHAGDTRFDLVARFSLSKSANLFGIMEYAGSTSVTLRASRPF